MLQRRPLSSFYLSLTSDRVSSYTTGGGWNPSLVSLSVLCNTRQIILPSERRECILQVSVIQVSILPADFTRHWHHCSSACSLPDCINTPCDTVDCIQFHTRSDISGKYMHKPWGRGKKTLTNKYRAPVKDRVRLLSARLASPLLNSRGSCWKNTLKWCCTSSALNEQSSEHLIVPNSSY